MNQHEGLQEIWQLEAELHRMKGQSNKYRERRIIMARIELLTKRIQKK